MDLYCTKHKKKLHERLTEDDYIYVYCLDCKMEEYKDDLSLHKGYNKLPFLVAVFFVFLSFLFFQLLNKHFINFLALLFSIVFFFLFKRLWGKWNKWTKSMEINSNNEMIRAQILNESSIQANKVEQKKRQWKIEFMRKHCKQKLDINKWEAYIRQFYRHK